MEDGSIESSRDCIVNTVHELDHSIEQFWIVVVEIYNATILFLPTQLDCP